MNNNIPYKFDSLSEVHEILGLPKPFHPLISLIYMSKIKMVTSNLPNPRIFNFYKISFKANLKGKIKYG